MRLRGINCFAGRPCPPTMFPSSRLVSHPLRPIYAHQVKLLLRAGADVLYTNRWGDLAIDDARRVQATPVVELLEPLVEQVCEHVWGCGEGVLEPQVGNVCEHVWMRGTCSRGGAEAGGYVGGEALRGAGGD